MGPPTIPPRLLGIPFRNRGSDAVGCDCWGLVVLASHVLWGRRVPRYEGYAEADGPGIADWIRDRWGDWEDIPPGEERPGDVAAFALELATPVHVGLVVAPGWMLHVMPGRDSCLELYARRYWRNTLVRFGRLLLP
jgi:cell wall-associated NlpC family hydrolase